MTQFLFLLQIVAPIFVVMAIGFGMRRVGVLTSEADHSLTRLVIVVLAPSLIFDAILGNDALRHPENWLLPPVLGFGSVLLGIVCARLGARVFRVAEGAPQRTFVFTTSLQNYGYIPLPICAALFPGETMGILFAFCLGVEVAFWSVALWQLTGRSALRRWWTMLNPPMVAIPLALVLNGLSAKAWLPTTVTATFDTLGACAVPMALILSGALVADQLDIAALRQGRRHILGSIAVRILIVPALMFLFAWLAPLNEKLRAVLVMQAAMPASIFSLVVTRAYGGDIRVAIQVVIGTSLIGLVTIPLWLSFGLRWILR